MKEQFTITLETPRLILRRLTLDDAKDMFYNWASDLEVTKYLNWVAHQNINVTKEIISSWIENYPLPHYYHWIIWHKDNQEGIGTISLFDVNLTNKSCEIGYCMSRKYWNQGIMTEACHRVLEFAFNDAGFEIIKARHMIENVASGKVMLKNNMRFIKNTTEFSATHNRTITLAHYEIKKEEFK